MQHFCSRVVIDTPGIKKLTFKLFSHEWLQDTSGSSIHTPSDILLP